MNFFLSSSLFSNQNAHMERRCATTLKTKPQMASPDVDDFLVSECCPITKVLEPTPPITSKQLCFEECQFEGCLEIPAYCFQGHTVPTLCGKHRMQGMQQHPECQGTSSIGSCLMKVSDTSMDSAEAPVC